MIAIIFLTVSLEKICFLRSFAIPAVRRCLIFLFFSTTRYGNHSTSVYSDDSFRTTKYNFVGSIFLSRILDFDLFTRTKYTCRHLCSPLVDSINCARVDNYLNRITSYFQLLLLCFSRWQTQIANAWGKTQQFHECTKMWFLYILLVWFIVQFDSSRKHKKNSSNIDIWWTLSRNKNIRVVTGNRRIEENINTVDSW